MKALSASDAAKLLNPNKLKIGQWNELASKSEGHSYVAFDPPRDALQLYVTVKRVLDWLPASSWKLLQIDNSTWPAEDEKQLFEVLAYGKLYSWNIDVDRSFLFDAVENGADEVKLFIIVIFAITFEWHLHVASDLSGDGRRLSIQDGRIFFIGDEHALSSAETLKQS